MALCEAMASGVPAVAMEYRPGVREIVRDGVDGVVVPAGDVPALAAAMGRLMDDPAERRRLGARAVEIVDRYGVDRVLGLWEALLRDSRALDRRRDARRGAGPESDPVTPAGPIRVALLIDTLRPAGAEKQLVTVATGLDRRRFAPRVLCLTDGGAYEDVLRAAGVPVTLIGKRHKVGGLALRRLRALLRRERPDVLHTWMFTCNLYGRLAALGLPIATLASEVAADVTKSAVRLAIDRLLAPSTRAFYVNSTLVARFYHERCGIPLEKLVVIPNGVRVPEMPRVPRVGPGRHRGRVPRVLRRAAVSREGIRPGHRGARDAGLRDAERRADHRRRGTVPRRARDAGRPARRWRRAFICSGTGRTCPAC